MIHPDDLNAVGTSIAEGLVEIAERLIPGMKYVLVLFPAGSTECPCGQPHVFVATNAKSEVHRALEQADKHVRDTPDVTWGEDLN